MKKVNVFGLCIHGLLGNVYSRGMDGLAALLNMHTPNGVHFNIVGGNDPDYEVSEIEARIDAAVAAGAVIVINGHSLGADMACRQARRLKAKGVLIPVLGVVDPVDWDSDANTFRAGRWEVDDNVGVVINPFQNVYPGGGSVYRAPGNTKTIIHQMHMPQYPHAALWGYDIGSCPETQHAILTAVQVMVAQLKAAAMQS